MTIDDRLTRAGQRFRDSHTEPATIHLAARPAPASGRPPRPRRRLVALAVVACAIAALTVGVVAWIGSSTPQRTGPAQPTPSGTTPLTDGAWVLTAAADASGDIALPTAPAHPLDLRFEAATDRFTASDGCNDISAVITGVGPRLILGRTLTTAVGCSDDDRFHAALAHVFSEGMATWTPVGDRLTITRDGITLGYDRQHPTPDQILGEWRLYDVHYNGAEIALPSEMPAALVAVFGKTAGQVTTNDGCNSLTAGYQVAGSTLVFAGGASTLKACLGGVQRLIDDVFAPGSGTWTVYRTTLTITRDGTTLDYSRP